MTPYVRTLLPESEVALFEKIRVAVNALPDIDLGADENGNRIVLSCHILARATAVVFGLKYVDGHFLNIYEHSWLLTKQGHIIDVYPVATMGGPILVEGIHFHESKNTYREGNEKEVSRGRFDKASFQRSVQHITRVLREISA